MEEFESHCYIYNLSIDTVNNAKPAWFCNLYFRMLLLMSYVWALKFSLDIDA